MSDTLIGVIVGGCMVIAGNVASQLLTHYLTAKKERQQEFLRRELDRIIRLEEFVGEIVEVIGGYGSLDEQDFRNRLHQLSIRAGTFRRYSQLKQNIRDLHNCAARLLRAEQRCEDDDEIRKDLEEKYAAFIKACDEVTGSRQI